jgi:hypothetical protein
MPAAKWSSSNGVPTSAATFTIAPTKKRGGRDLVLVLLTMEAQPNQHHGWWEPLWELVVHVILGSLLFAIIFAPAVALDLTIQWLENTAKITESLAKLLTWTKYAIGGIDASLYLLFMLKMSWIFLRKLFWGVS